MAISGKRSLGSKIFDMLNVIIMIFILIVMLYPFLNQLAISLNDSTDAIKGGIYLWPREFSLDAYKFVLADDELLQVTMNSVLRVMVGTTTSVVATAFLAYIITIHHFSGRKFMRRLFVLTMYFSGGLIPVYLLMVNLGLNESFTIYWLPSMFSAYNMLLIASYMQSVPDTLRESARIDGASEMVIFFKIMIPMCLPVLAAICIFNGVGHWNSWFDTMIYNPSGKWDTLQVYLRRILLEAEALSKITDQQQAANEMAKLTVVTVRAATTMIVTVPIALIYPFFQKYFVSGITLGAVKE